mgnify:FL=1
MTVRFTSAIIAVALLAGSGVVSNVQAGPGKKATADAPGVRAAVYAEYRGDLVVIARQKGVAEILRPKTGLFCVKLTRKSKIKNAEQTVPVVAPVSTRKGSASS